MSKNEMSKLLSQVEIVVEGAGELKELTTEEMATVVGGIGGGPKGGHLHPDLNIGCNTGCRKPKAQ